MGRERVISSEFIRKRCWVGGGGCLVKDGSGGDIWKKKSSVFSLASYFVFFLTSFPILVLSVR